jgi:ferritin-like metal-binding protein YciE
MRDLYDAEKQLVKALPKVVKAAPCPELREVISRHLARADPGQVDRLRAGFKVPGGKREIKPCLAMQD